MVIEVTYLTKEDGARPNSKVRRVEYFESSAMPDKPTIASKLAAMHKDFAANTISISEHEEDDAETMRGKGFRVTKL